MTSGLMASRSPLALSLGLALACASSGCSDRASSDPRPTLQRGLIVIGVDGMDPVLLQRYLDAGRMPNLARLAGQGSLMSLGTSNPPQSPVAWSTFITGQDSGGHGIYDFVHRDPRALAPYLSTSRTQGPEDVLTLGPWALSLDSATVELLRAGTAFWQYLERARVPGTLVKIPANFPPVPSHHSESLAGMGTPDLLGTYGTFGLYTDDPRFADRPLTGGVLHRLDFSDDDQRASASLVGPTDPTSARGTSLSLPVEVLRDRQRDVALVRVGDTEVILTPGEFSAWLPVTFDPGLLGDPIAGMVRLYLASVRPHVRLHMSPINLDPTRPAMPLSSPRSYATHLARDVGRFYTQGMAEDTKALIAGALSDDEFLAQADQVYQERLQMLERELARYQGGLLFFYISSIDQVSHVFWRALADDAAPADARYAHVIPDLYARVDRALGPVIDRISPDVQVVVMSDHGFAAYDRQVHLNTWLAERSYLALLPPGEVRPGPLGHIDWDHTQAYALGLNQLFINLQGRESRGAVPPADRDVLLARLQRDLESWRDPDTGAHVVTQAVRPPVGAFARRAPDLLVGYNRGYRSSDRSALGAVGNALIEDNRSKWSGDHCMHPDHVPGVLLTSWRMSADRQSATLADLAPTILDYFAIPVPTTMTGSSLYRGP